MRPRINFQKNGTSVPFFIFSRKPKSKMDFKIIMPRQKRFVWAKKFFSRNTPGVLSFNLRECMKSIVHVLSAFYTRMNHHPYNTPYNARLVCGRASRSFRK